MPRNAMESGGAGWSAKGWDGVRRGQKGRRGVPWCGEESRRMGRGAEDCDEVGRRLEESGGVPRSAMQWGGMPEEWGGAPMSAMERR